jgi:anthranilate synthase/aminodeoxychorismate synthase-like glutamine amidotransferase
LDAEANMLLLIDNFDSFVHNLARYFRRLGQSTTVARNDELSPGDVEHLAPQAIVISPGPSTPQNAGNSLEVVRRFHKQIPMLGVCLGHQVIAEALGGRVVRAPEPRHGRTSPVLHDQKNLFAGLPNPLTVCRYHSLVVEPHTLPAALRPTARTEDDILMALEHERYPVFGVQFHPEAILTDEGYQLLANFLSLAGMAVAREVADLGATEQHVPTPVSSPLGGRVVTF